MPYSSPADPSPAEQLSSALGPLDQAYEEYCRLEEAGTPPPLEGFLCRYPEPIRADLCRLIDLHHFLDANPDALLQPSVPRPSAAGLGDFEIVREIGRGRFARAYLARETTAGNRGVVLKVSAGADDEARTQGPLAHPHVMRVLAAHHNDDRTVVVMPFLGLATLADIIRACAPAGGRASARGVLDACRLRWSDGEPLVAEVPPFPVTPTGSFADAVAAVGAGVAAALAFLHARGHAHQDVKPSNVLLAPSGHPYLMDFNLADRTGGTVPYMAPERLAEFNGAPASPCDRAAADVFSLGVLLHEFLTGRPPVATPPVGTRLSETIEHYAAAYRGGVAPLAPPERRANPALASIIARCLASDPVRRPTAADVAAELRPPAVRRRWSVLASTVAATVAVGGALGGLLPAGRPSLTPPPPTSSDPSSKFAFDAFQLSTLGHHKPALRFGNDAIRLGTTDPAVFSNRGFNYYQLGRYAEALADLNTAVALSQVVMPETRLLRAEAALNLFHTTARRDQLPAAIEDLMSIRTSRLWGGHASLTAAKLYIALAEGHPDLLRSAVHFLHEALALGASPKNIRNTRFLTSALRKQPGFDDTIRERPEPPPTRHPLLPLIPR